MPDASREPAPSPFVATPTVTISDVVAHAPDGVALLRGDPTRPVARVAIVDPTRPLPPVTGALVLAIGVDHAAAMAFLDALSDAGAAGCVLAAVVLEALDLTRLPKGLAVLAIDDRVDWTDLLHLAPPSGLLLDVATDVAGAPGDLGALVNGLAALSGAAITLEDSTLKLLAYANLDHEVDHRRQQTIMQQQTPPARRAALEEAGVMKRLRAGEIVELPADPQAGICRRIAAPVHAGGRFLGCLWILESDAALHPQITMILPEVSQLTAFHVMRHRTVVDLLQRSRGEALLALVRGKVDGGTALIVSARAPVRVVVGHVEHDAIDVTGMVQARRLADAIQLHVDPDVFGGVAISVGSTVYATMPGAWSDEDVALFGENVIREVRRSGPLEVRLGISRSVSSPGRVAAAAAEAQHALDVAPDAPVAVADRLAGPITLREVQRMLAAREELSGGVASLLRAHDAANGTSLAATLHAFLRHRGGVAAAAQELGIHVNTLANRMARVRSLVPHDLDDPAVWQVALLELGTPDDNNERRS